MKTIAKMLWRGKVAMLAVVIALTLVAGGTAVAKAKLLKTTLEYASKAGLTGAMMKLTNDQGGSALDLVVNSGVAPLTVNSDAGTATNLSADKVDGQSFACPNGTLFHEGACIETAKRNQTNFTAAETACRDASRRLPTIAELQSLRFRGGHDFTTDNGEWTSHIGQDGTLKLAASVNGSSGFTDIGVQDVSRHFRCVALPS